MANRIITPVSTSDYREFARRKLPSFLFHYLDGGANDEHTLARNVADFGRWRLRQRVMCDTSAVDPGAHLAGQSCAMPLALAPIGLAGMMARRGEAQAGRAAAAAGVPMALSTVSICPVEEVMASGGPVLWYQLYMLRDRDLVLQMLQRIRGLGIRTLLLTVDLSVEGVRRRDTRYAMVGETAAARMARAWQILSHPRWAYEVGLRGKPHDFGNVRFFGLSSNDLNAYKAFLAQQFDPGVTWRDIAWLRERWDGRVYIKGVLTAEDAVAAVDAGADGVVVSNHGGRQLDGVPSTISALPPIARAIGGRAEVLLDGGVRSGIDVIRAIALGAAGVLIGRPWAYAVAARGQAGVTQLLEMFRREMVVAMTLMGVNRLDELSADMLDRDDGPI